MGYGAISSDFERKILRPRKIFEIFDPKCAAHRTESHAPRRADARHHAWGPLWLAGRLRIVNFDVKRRGFRCDLTRFRTKNCATAKIFENFDRESHRIARAAACRRSAQLSGTSYGRKQAAHHLAAWISARSHAISNEKFRGREKFSKISVKNLVRIARNLMRRSMLTLGTVVADL